MNGIHNTLITTIPAVVTLPTNPRLSSLAAGRHFYRHPVVISVEPELKTELKDDIRSACSAATIIQTNR